MDGRRFDLLTRRLAARSPRRTLLRGAASTALAAAFARFGRVEAQTVCRRVGVRCDTHAQCCEPKRCGPQGTCVCRDGFVPDNSGSCRSRNCRKAGLGIGCFSAADCCEPGVCGDEGTCVCPPEYEAEVHGLCQGVLPLGARCTEGQCARHSDCEDNGDPNDGALNCCLHPNPSVEGPSRCSEDGHCCGDVRCSEGICGGKKPAGATCFGPVQCSQLGGTTYCANNGNPNDGARNCCRGRGGDCLNDGQCCGTLSCAGGVCCATPPCDAKCCPTGHACTQQDPEVEPTSTVRVCCPPRQVFTDPASPPEQFCCPPAKTCLSGTTAPDRCCHPDEVCLNNACCRDGALGTTICGGACCPEASCCYDTCCPSNQVCVRRTPGARLSCAPAGRTCAAAEDCLASETCVGGRCCSGHRICSEVNPDTGLRRSVCCAYGFYCDRSAGKVTCCPVGQSCNTERRDRIRP